jgi:hypothetical protein
MDVMHTCRIINNLVVESRRESYSGTRNASNANPQAHVGTLVKVVTEPEDLRGASLFLMAR